MSEKWREIINVLTFIKKECVNKEKLIQQLEIDYTVDEEVLDNLYILGILDIQEYTKQMEKVTGNTKIRLSLCEKRMEYAKDEKENFTPMSFYGCCNPDCGNAINLEKYKNYG